MAAEARAKMRWRFGDADYFSRRFRQWTGVTPREFRESGRAVQAG